MLLDPSLVRAHARSDGVRSLGLIHNNSRGQRAARSLRALFATFRLDLFMDGIHITRPFERMGARVELVALVPNRRFPSDVRVDIVKDQHGQKFSIQIGANSRICIADARPDQQHLLLACSVLDKGLRHKFLCGHDEREWFVAAVPNRQGISSVRNAMEALKPDSVKAEILRRGVHPSEYASRRTAAYKRQGEWFFLPQEGLRFPAHLVLRNEAMRRGRGKPHWAEFAYRTGGEFVYFNDAYPAGLTEVEYKALITRNAGLAQIRWQTGRRGAELYVRGRIRHPDHATITLDCWHLVRMNTESESEAMSHLAFID